MADDNVPESGGGKSKERELGELFGRLFSTSSRDPIPVPSVPPVTEGASMCDLRDTATVSDLYRTDKETQGHLAGFAYDIKLLIKERQELIAEAMSLSIDTFVDDDDLFSDETSAEEAKLRAYLENTTPAKIKNYIENIKVGEVGDDMSGVDGEVPGAVQGERNVDKMAVPVNAKPVEVDAQTKEDIINEYFREKGFVRALGKWVYTDGSEAFRHVCGIGRALAERVTESSVYKKAKENGNLAAALASLGAASVALGAVVYIEMGKADAREVYRPPPAFAARKLRGSVPIPFASTTVAVPSPATPSAGPTSSPTATASITPAVIKLDSFYEITSIDQREVNPATGALEAVTFTIEEIPDFREYIKREFMPDGTPMRLKAYGRGSSSTTHLRVAITDQKDASELLGGQPFYLDGSEYRRAAASVSSKDFSGYGTVITLPRKSVRLIPDDKIQKAIDSAYGIK